MDNTRAEKLKDNIDEYNKDISKIQVVIQKLKDVDNLVIDDVETKTEINQLINNLDFKIKFLEDLKESDEKTLNLFC